MNEDLDLVRMEALLRRAANAFAYPPTPHVAGAVQSRLRERVSLADKLGSTQAGWWRKPAMAALGMALAVFVALGAAIAVPQSRGALADFFHLSHVRIDTRPTTGLTPMVLAAGNFARPSTVDEARQAVDFPLKFPTRDGVALQPDAVYMQGENSNMPVAIFVYEQEGYDLYQTRQGFFGKGVDRAIVHQISFAGHGAYWIDEGGHIAQFLDAQGRTVVESRRTVERATLLWEESGITYRLETSLPQADAIALAESLR
jgi:hypothetical protein